MNDDLVPITIYCYDRKFHGPSGLMIEVVYVEKNTEETWIDRINNGEGLKTDACPVHGFEFITARPGDGWTEENKALGEYL